MNHHLLLIIHLICAAVWVGGHIYLALRILPRSLKNRDVALLLQFEKSYEPVGMPALALLVITGLWMSAQFGIRWQSWFSFSSPLEKIVSLKIILLLFTVLLAISAQKRVIPRLKQDPSKLFEMALHIIAVTLAGIAMLVLGSFVRYGGL